MLRVDRIASVPFVGKVEEDQDTGVDLEAIKNARGDINEIRLLLKGSKETCHKLFKEAVKQGDVITQIQLSYALFGMGA